LAIAGSALGAVLALAGWLLVGTWQVREGLAKAKRQIQAEDHASARARLARLSQWWPRHDEVEYLLGMCEAELGRADAALAAWSRVPRRSPLAAARAHAQGRILVRSLGRLRDAELLYRQAARGTGASALEARWSLAELLLWEGRLDEMRRLLQEIARI